MLQRNYEARETIWLKLATIIALTIAYLFSGCKVSKNFNANKSDTTSVQKATVAVVKNNEGAAVRTETNRSREENEWTRLTLKYLSEKEDGDTTINHLITQPATVIYESGRFNRNEESKRVDSSWYHSMMHAFATSTDSMNRRIDNYEKSKRSRTTGTGLLVWLIAGFIVLLMLRFLRAQGVFGTTQARRTPRSTES